MIREALKKMKSTEFKYNEENWKVSYQENKLEIDVSTGDSWMSAVIEEVRVKNQKDAIKKAKKIIDNLEKSY